MDSIINNNELPKETFHLLTNKKLIHGVKRDIKLGDKTFITLDISINGYDDEIVYEKNKQVRDIIPRGLCLIIHNDKIIHTLAGMRKFGYEEDHCYEIKLEGKEEIIKEVYTTKENGECFHLSAFVLDNEQYIICGSKNVHGILRAKNLQDDKLLYGEQRYNFMRMMLDQLDLKNLQSVIDYLISSKTTFVAESCSTDSQHIVKYANSGLIFFAICKWMDKSYCLNPKDSADIFEKLGLRHVHISKEIVLSKDLNEREQLRNEYSNSNNCEGAVVYQITNENRVVKVYKLKSNDYVFQRAVREKMRSMSSSNQIMKRINELHVKPIDWKQKLEFFLRFNAWCRINHKGNYEHVFTHWADLVIAFKGLKETEQKKWFDKFESATKNKQVQLIAIGIPACGKTTLLKKVIDNYGGIYIDQDQFNGNPHKYHKEVHGLTGAAEMPIVALGKNHHNKQQRQNLFNFVNIGQIVFVTFYHPGGKEELAKLCIDRASKRQGHMLKAEKANEVITGFIGSSEELTEDEIKSYNIDHFKIIKIDVTKNMDEQYKVMLEELKEFNIRAKPINPINPINPNKKKQNMQHKKDKPKFPQFWSIDLSIEDTARIYEMKEVKTLMDENKFTKPPDLHVTLLYMGGKENPDEKTYSSLEGNKIIVNISEIVHSSKCMCFKVSNVKSSNKQSHITLGLNGVKPVYSNELLELADKNDHNVHTIRFEKELMFEGIVKKH